MAGRKNNTETDKLYALNLGILIREMRVRQAYSVSSLAEALETDRQVVYQWERGASTPRAAQLGFLGQVLPGFLEKFSQLTTSIY